jgi:hypothetical protein
MASIYEGGLNTNGGDGAGGASELEVRAGAGRPSPAPPNIAGNRKFRLSERGGGDRPPPQVPTWDSELPGAKPGGSSGSGAGGVSTSVLLLGKPVPFAKTPEQAIKGAAAVPPSHSFSIFIHTP